MALEAINLSKSFRNKAVVDSVSFTVNAGEVVGLLGPNGAGKTTSFYMVVGLVKPAFGSVLLEGEDITTLPMYKRARLGISYLPQNMSIFRKLTVRQNLLAIMEVCGVPREKRKRFIGELLEKFQITHIKNSCGAALSGGERRRVEIARSLINKPKYLLLDEPFAGVDPVTVQEIQEIILNLKNNDKIGILITDHNVRETLGSCNRSYVLSSGSIIAHGDRETILATPLVKEIYLGEKFKI